MMVLGVDVGTRQHPFSYVSETTSLASCWTVCLMFDYDIMYTTNNISFIVAFV